MNEPWRVQAACRGMDPNLFHPDSGGFAGQRAAKAVCWACPVREACLEYAVTNGERYGIWGGMSERQRRELVRDQRETSRVCLVCGVAFPLEMVGGQKPLLCSDACRRVWNTQRKRKYRGAA